MYRERFFSDILSYVRLMALHRGAAQVGGDVDTGAELIIAAACASGALRGAAVVFHLHHRGDGVAAVVVQLGILIQQLLGVLRQIEGGIAGDGLDPQRLADLHHRIKGGTSDAVVQRTVDGR